MGKTKFLLLFIMLICVVSGVNSAANAQNDTLYFPETGYWIRGEFLRYYRTLKDPFLILGYPISNEGWDYSQNKTRKIQYFQRARLEIVEGVVQRTKLGEYFYKADEAQPPDIPTNGATCRFFPETGKNVCYAFLQFYEKWDGVKNFGYPISNLEMLNGRYAQHFEYTRLEWRPETTSGEKLVPADLGRIYYDIMGGGMSGINPTPAGYAAPGKMTKLQAFAFVANPLPQPKSDQIVSVIVQDQELNPVSGATILVKVHFPEGIAEYPILQPTDINGIARLNFSVGDRPYNTIIRVEVLVNYQGIQITTNSWFRIWY